MNPGSRLSKPMILMLPHFSLIFFLFFFLILAFAVTLVLSAAIFASFSFPA